MFLEVKQKAVGEVFSNLQIISIIGAALFLSVFF
jgi:hypothetical protein